MAATLGNIYIKDSADWNTYLDLIYPVGSIYITTSSTSPASSIGGSWSQIEPGTFLMTAGETYNVLSTGGENTHKLTVSEMPGHTHTADMCWIENTADKPLLLVSLSTETVVARLHSLLGIQVVLEETKPITICQNILL